MSKYVVMMGWDEAPHLSAEAKEKILSGFPPHQRAARTKGQPQIGAGAIFPVPEDDILCEPFAIPDNWRRSYGLDVGWNRTACVWGAQDPGSRVIYLYDEHYQGREEPSIHASAIRARGEWIEGAIDPAAKGRSQVDGTQLLESYRALGLHLTPANNAVAAGITELWQAMISGSLKVFRGKLPGWMAEFRTYQYDTHGNVNKVKDHAMDATRYFWMSGRDVMKTKPVEQQPQIAEYGYGYARGSGSAGWMG